MTDPKPCCTPLTVARVRRHVCAANWWQPLDTTPRHLELVKGRAS